MTEKKNQFQVRPVEFFDFTSGAAVPIEAQIVAQQLESALNNLWDEGYSDIEQIDVPRGLLIKGSLPERGSPQKIEVLPLTGGSLSELSELVGRFTGVSKAAGLTGKGQEFIKHILKNTPDLPVEGILKEVPNTVAKSLVKTPLVEVNDLIECLSRDKEQHAKSCEVADCSLDALHEVILVSLKAHAQMNLQ